MAGNSVKFWQKKWDNYIREVVHIQCGIPREHVSECATQDQIKYAYEETAIRILADYSGFVYNDVFGLPRPCLGSTGRFFKGKWNHHHGDAIQKAINRRYDAMDHDIFNGVTEVLSSVKKEIGDSDIKPDGDLARILLVIKLSTGVDYFDDNVVPIQEKENSMSPGLCIIL